MKRVIALLDNHMAANGLVSGLLDQGLRADDVNLFDASPDLRAAQQAHPQLDYLAGLRSLLDREELIDGGSGRPVPAELRPAYAEGVALGGFLVTA
ncbi:MAG: hypothetical protein AB1409_12780, partial [Pseudomonadota bacterium]